jgi:hypothetical protein
MFKDLILFRDIMSKYIEDIDEELEIIDNSFEYEGDLHFFYLVKDNYRIDPIYITKEDLEVLDENEYIYSYQYGMWMI